MLGYSERSVFAWVALVTHKGPVGLRMQRRTDRPPKLPAQDKQRLKDWVYSAPKDFGFEGEYWTCGMLRELLHQHTSVFYAEGYIATLLRGFGCTWFKQDVVPDKASPEKQRLWRETIWPQLLAKAAQEGAAVVFQNKVGFDRSPSGTYGWGDRKRIRAKTIQASGGSCKLVGTLERGSGKVVWHLFSKKKKGEKYSHRDFVAFLGQVVAAYTGHVPTLCRRRWNDVPLGTIAYRFDILPPDVIQHGIKGSHLNLYVANQSPPQAGGRCFWNRSDTVAPPPLPG